MLREKGREGNALSVQGLALSAVTPNCDTQLRAPERELGWDLPSPGSQRPHSQAAPAWAGSRLQPPPSAEPAACNRRIPAPLVRKPGEYAATALATSLHSNNAIPNYLGGNGEVCRHREMHYLRSPKWDSSGSGWCWSPRAIVVAV